MKRNTFILLCLFAALHTVARADEGDNLLRRTVKGVVLDETGAPLPGATIQVQGTTIGAGTNAKGEFTLLLREATTQSLLIRFTGYTTGQYTLEAHERNPLTICLSPAENALDEVVVTGTRTEKPLKEVPVLTRVISQKAIQELNPMDMETLLQYQLPGIQFRYDGMSQQPKISYQGMEGSYLLFLIDGERVSGEGADHNVDFTRFNIDDIERIEVVKGAQSTLYGSNALGGVINIITKGANRPFTGNVSARYGNKSGQKYSVSAGTKLSRLSSYTSLTHRQRDTYTVSDDLNATTIKGYETWDASQKFGYAFTDRLSAEVRGSYYYNKRGMRETEKVRDLFADYAVNGKLKYLFNINHTLDFSYTFDDFTKDKDYVVTGRTLKNYSNRTQTARLNYTGNFGTQHTLTVGMEMNSEYLKHYMFKDSTNHSQQYYVLYAQEDWRLTDQLNIIAGLRTDCHSEYSLHATPKISAMYRPLDMLTLRVGYAQGFRTPTLKELYEEYDMGGLGMFIIYGNPDLKPETSHQFSLSAEVTQGIFYASLSGYHNRFRNKITQVDKVNDTPTEENQMPDLTFVNADGAQTTGLEAIARVNMDCGVMLQSSYSYVNDQQQVEGYNTSPVRPHSLTFDTSFRRKFGKIGTSLTLNGQWASKLRTHTRDSDTGVYTYTTYDARTLCSLNAGVQLPHGIGINIGVDNLLNYKDKAADANIQLPQQGISFVGTLTVNLADLFKL